MNLEQAGSRGFGINVPKWNFVEPVENRRPRHEIFRKLALHCNGYRQERVSIPLRGSGDEGVQSFVFLLARQQGHKQPAEWAQFVWSILAAQGKRLLKEGATLESAEDNIAEITAQAQSFADKQLPVLRALMVA